MGLRLAWRVRYCVMGAGRAVTDAVIIAIVKYAEVKEVFGMEVISTGHNFLLGGKQARDNDLRSGEISGTKSSRGGCTYRMVLK